MDKFKKVIEEQIIKNIAEDVGDMIIFRPSTTTPMTIVKFVIERYKAELARNKELGVG